MSFTIGIALICFSIVLFGMSFYFDDKVTTAKFYGEQYYEGYKTMANMSSSLKGLSISFMAAGIVISVLTLTTNCAIYS